MMRATFPEAPMAETRQLTALIDSDVDDELTAIAQATGRDKQSLARDAISAWLDDAEDVRDAEAVLAEGNPSLPLSEVKRRLGLAG
jgi:predicted DNA-binding protein